MARIDHFLVMMFVVLVVVKAEESTFKCDNGPERQRASALCIGFLTNFKQLQPSSECCMAYRVFVKTAKTTEERRQLCDCVQGRARTSPRPVSIANVDALQTRCGLPFMYSADPNFDCNTVN